MVNYRRRIRLTGLGANGQVSPLFASQSRAVKTPNIRMRIQPSLQTLLVFGSSETGLFEIIKCGGPLSDAIALAKGGGPVEDYAHWETDELIHGYNEITQVMLPMQGVPVRYNRAYLVAATVPPRTRCPRTRSARFRDQWPMVTKEE